MLETLFISSSNLHNLGSIAHDESMPSKTGCLFSRPETPAIEDADGSPVRAIAVCQ